MRPATERLLSVALPDLERHVPLLPEVRGKVVDKLKAAIVPDFLIDMHSEASVWMREVKENEEIPCRI